MSKELGKGKSLFSEKETHRLMAKVCGKSRTEKNLDTFISGTTKTFRDAFVLTAALGALSGEPLIELPSNENEINNTVDSKDIKIEHNNLLKTIAYWHEGKLNKNENCHEILNNINKIRKIGELYCYAGKESLMELVKTNLFDNELIKKILKI